MIGIFDSGSGGLTVLKAVRDRLPSADVLYFGDIKYAPYGNRSRAEISQRTMFAVRTLVERGATSIISACNSTSASLAISLLDSLDLKADSIIEMVGPTVSEFRGSSARLLLVATEATIRSEIYQNAFLMIGKEVETLAIPELAGGIEAGASEEELERIVRAAFSGIDTTGIDAVVLACTHYPLAERAFRKVLGDRIALVDPAEAVADRVERLWWPKEVRDGKTRFLITEDSEVFRERVRKLFPGAETAIEVLE